jgi:hypothetical protein
MAGKKVLKVVLLVFVLAGFGYGVWRSVAAEREKKAATAKAGEGKEKTVVRSEFPDVNEPTVVVRTGMIHQKVVVYYFHGTKRCVTCEKLESYAFETLTKYFSGDLAAGRIEWQSVNVDKTENEHFVEDYQLATKAVVLSRVTGGEESGWRNLDKVWQLVGHKQEYQAYVRSEIEVFMKEASE